MSLEKIKGELYELVDYLIDNDSYLKGKLKDKKVSRNNVREDIEKDLKKGVSKSTEEILVKQLDNLEENRGGELLKKYGGLLLNSSVLKRNGVGDKSKKDFVISVDKELFNSSDGLIKLGKLCGDKIEKMRKAKNKVKGKLIKDGIKNDYSKE